MRDTDEGQKPLWLRVDRTDHLTVDRDLRA